MKFFVWIKKHENFKIINQTLFYFFVSIDSNYNEKRMYVECLKIIKKKLLNVKNYLFIDNF